jgi:hypothetical protein
MKAAVLVRLNSCGLLGQVQMTTPKVIKKNHISSKYAFLYVSLVGSTTISMTYSINVRPYNDP